MKTKKRKLADLFDLANSFSAHALIMAAAILCWSVPATSRAAGLLIADGGLGGVLEVKEHEAQVTINNGIAVTKVTQVFHNTEKRQVEALYTFPVPKAASVANFSMWINGKEMVGEVLEKQRAREIYDSSNKWIIGRSKCASSQFRRRRTRRCKSPTTRNSIMITTRRHTFIRWRQPRAKEWTPARPENLRLASR
jgi:hypothetical protein